MQLNFSPGNISANKVERVAPNALQDFRHGKSVLESSRSTFNCIDTAKRTHAVGAPNSTAAACTKGGTRPPSFAKATDGRPHGLAECAPGKPVRRPGSTYFNRVPRFPPFTQ